MSKLPPLPPATGQYFFGSATSGHWEGLIRESIVREYGQQCRDAALDEAAKVCDELKNKSGDLCDYAAYRIRGLK